MTVLQFPACPSRLLPERDQLVIRGCRVPVADDQEQVQVSLTGAGTPGEPAPPEGAEPLSIAGVPSPGEPVRIGSRDYLPGWVDWGDRARSSSGMPGGEGVRMVQETLPDWPVGTASDGDESAVDQFDSLLPPPAGGTGSTHKKVQPSAGRAYFRVRPREHLHNPPCVPSHLSLPIHAVIQVHGGKPDPGRDGKPDTIGPSGVHRVPGGVPGLPGAAVQWIYWTSSGGERDLSNLSVPPWPGLPGEIADPTPPLLWPASFPAGHGPRRRAASACRSPMI